MKRQIDEGPLRVEGGSTRKFADCPTNAVRMASLEQCVRRQAVKSRH
jgi:hypothetical protein